MAVTIKLPTQLRDAAGNQTEAQVDGATVGEALSSLYEQHGELRQRIADDGGGLRRFVNVYLGGEDIRFLDGLDTPVVRRRRAHDPAGRRGRLTASTTLAAMRRLGIVLALLALAGCGDDSAAEEPPRATPPATRACTEIGCNDLAEVRFTGLPRGRLCDPGVRGRSAAS